MNKFFGEFYPCKEIKKLPKWAASKKADVINSSENFSHLMFREKRHLLVRFFTNSVANLLSNT